MNVHEASGAAELNEVLFESRKLTIGGFRADPGHPRFRDSGPIENHIFVFPSAAVWIDDPSAPGFVADPNLATFYNRGHLYRRRAIDPRGDASIWLAPAEGLLRQVLGAAGHQGRAEAPFAWRHRLVPPAAYCLLTSLVRCLRTPLPLDDAIVERAAARLLEALVPRRQGQGTEPGRPRAEPNPAHLDLAERTKELLDLRFREPLTVAGIAVEVGCSQYHLARIFRAHVGLSIHAYRDQLRMRIALRRLRDVRSLTDLALELGYDSHSHFSSRFRRTFGMAPSTLREAGRSRLRKLVTRLSRSPGERPVSR